MAALDALAAFGVGKLATRVGDESGPGTRRDTCRVPPLTTKQISVPPFGTPMSRGSPLIRFDSLKSVEDLCFALQRSPHTVRSLSNVSSHATKLVVRRKKSGRPREVYKVTPPLREVHRLLALSLAKAHFPWPRYVQGYVKGRSALTNAQLHVAGPNRLTCDLEGFFDHITAERIALVWESLGTSRQVAVILAELCSLEGKLIQGGRASPLIANVACLEMDRELVRLAAGCRYSRYADDLAFSGAELPTRAHISEVVAFYGFSIGADSWIDSTKCSGGRLMGLSLGGRRARLSRKKRAHIEDEVRAAVTSGKTSERLMGRIASLAKIEPRLFEDWRDRLP